MQGQAEQSSIPFCVCVCQSLKAVIALYPNKEGLLQIRLLSRQRIPNKKGFHELGKTFYFQASRGFYNIKSLKVKKRKEKGERKRKASFF